jgi:hypothetical protein
MNAGLTMGYAEDDCWSTSDPDIDWQERFRWVAELKKKVYVINETWTKYYEIIVIKVKYKI